jgi:hypothetical protein
MSKTIIKAKAHLKLHQESRCIQEAGILSSSQLLFKENIGK